MEKNIVTITTSTGPNQLVKKTRTYSDLHDALNDKNEKNNSNDTNDESCCQLCGNVVVDTILYMPATVMVWADAALEKLAKHKAE